MNGNILQKGQKVSCILYDGNSKIEASVTFDYLENARKNNKPIPLGHTNLFIHVTEVEMVEGKNHAEKESTYKVRLEGVLE